jgi:hypothetical protein
MIALTLAAVLAAGAYLAPIAYRANAASNAAAQAKAEAQKAAILAVLTDEAKPASQIAEETGLGISTKLTVRHLSALKKAGKAKSHHAYATPTTWTRN